VQLDANRRRHKLVLTFLDQHEEAIRDALQAAVKRAVNVFDSGMLVPGRVLAALSDVIVKIVRTILERGIAATTFPGWLIQHTIIQVGDDPPRSAVLLHSLEDPNVTLVGAQMVAGTMRAVRDYSHFDVPQLWPRGRILLGRTLPAGAAADLEMVPPPELWKWVDAYQHPVVWSDAMENGQPPTRGFRVLLPFAPLPSRRTGKRPNGPHYVAALRVEVYFHAGFVL
jgi:hypothetical protein